MRLNGETGLNQQLSTALVMAVISLVMWLLMDHSQRVTVVTLLALGSVFAVMTAWHGLGERAGSFGIALSAWGLHAVAVVLFFGFIAHLARTVKGRCLRVTLLMAAGWIVIPVIAGETWFGIEDHVFAREIRASGVPYDVRPRARPFSGHYLIYTNGNFSAR